MEDLQQRWKYLYAEYLPSLAKAKDPSQHKWPVVLDHCFARIIPDNAVGKDKPWAEVIKSPAIKNMTEEQLQTAIRLAEDIVGGEANLVELDERSLELRGKKSKLLSKRKAGEGSTSRDTAKKQRRDETVSSYFLPSPSYPPPAAKPKLETKSPTELATGDSEIPPNSEAEERETQLARISQSSLTPFRKLTLSLLLQIPRGRHSTYQAMADHITSTQHKTCARAVGNAMRNNPFAPGVPCHRVLASDGTLGGFRGHWGEDGKFAGEKKRLLGSEGVKFDSTGKVKGAVFREFEKG